MYEIRSTANEGSAQIVIIFNYKKDLVEAADEIRNAIGAVALQVATGNARTGAVSATIRPTSR